MTDQDHNLRLLGVLIVAALAILLAMCSCTTKTLTEYIEVHDTVNTHHTDTLREVKVTHHTDTVRQVETHTYTINNVGDTIKEIHHYHDIQHTIVVDSTDRYQSKVDSLQSVIDKMREKEKVVVKKKPWWKLPVILSVLVVLTAGGLWLIKKFK